MRDIPEATHRALKARAAMEGRTLSELLREELIALGERPSMSEMLDRIAARTAVPAGESAADAIRAARAER